MADWTTIADTALDPDAPVTSELAYAWRDNPIAISEGAPSAPRIRPEAIAKRSGWVVGQGGLPAAIVGLGGVGFVAMGYRIDAASFGQVGITTDGGASWSGWSTLTPKSGIIIFDRVEGTLRDLLGAGADPLFSGLTTLNGIRVRASSGGVGESSRLTIMDICGMVP